MKDELVFIPVPEQEKNDVSELSKKGYILLKENKTEEAIGCFTSILKLADSNNYALVGIGDAYRKIHD
jgi:hypothetical protein